jgi:hypothetical protein
MEVGRNTCVIYQHTTIVLYWKSGYVPSDVCEQKLDFSPFGQYMIIINKCWDTVKALAGMNVGQLLPFLILLFQQAPPIGYWVTTSTPYAEEKNAK